jgi:hypothetical protein
MAPLATESLFWIAAAACAVAQVAILRAVLGGETQAMHGSVAAGEPDRSAPGRGTRRLSEAAWALLPGIALAFVLIWTWRAVHPIHHPPPATASQPRLSPATGA